MNFHTSNATFHAQHRDIYSAKQRGGLNCTCQFRACVGTICYTVGASRQVLCETMTDDLSPVTACGEDCRGTSETRYLRSGESMYFNEDWNNAHTHGIPQTDEKSGPRISIAFLLGARAGEPEARPLILPPAKTLFE